MVPHKLGLRLSLSCLALGALALSACGNQGGAAQGGYGRGMPQVTVVTLKSQPVTLTRELPGRTSAYLVAEVRPQVSGIVKRRLFTEGAQVKAGDLLYELDDAIYRAQYESSQAALARAQTVLENAQLASARSQELAKVDAVSTQDNENAVAVERQAQADVALQKAAVQSSSINLGYARITSPISGRIGKSTVTQGALVTANQSAALATVQQLDPIYIDVSQSSGEWLQLKHEIDNGRVQAGGTGTLVKILLEDGSSYPQEGRLQFADVTVDTGTGSLLLRAIVPNAGNTLMPGMYVRAVLSEGVLKEGLLVPQQGVTRDPKGNATALVVAPDGKVELRPVRVSRAIGDHWLVDGGLAAGDRVIVEGVQKVQPGAMAQAVEAAGTAAAAAR